MCLANRNYTVRDIVEAHCYVVITSESILSEYIAESQSIEITDCRTFQPRRPSSTAYTSRFCTQLLKAYVAETSYNQFD